MMNEAKTYIRTLTLEPSFPAADRHLWNELLEKIPEELAAAIAKAFKTNPSLLPVFTGFFREVGKGLLTNDEKLIRDVFERQRMLVEKYQKED